MIVRASVKDEHKNMRSPQKYADDIYLNPRTDINNKNKTAALHGVGMAPINGNSQTSEASQELKLPTRLKNNRPEETAAKKTEMSDMIFSDMEEIETLPEISMKSKLRKFTVKEQPEEKHLSVDINGRTKAATLPGASRKFRSKGTSQEPKSSTLLMDNRSKKSKTLDSFRNAVRAAMSRMGLKKAREAEKLEKNVEKGKSYKHRMNIDDKDRPSTSSGAGMGSNNGKYRATEKSQEPGPSTAFLSEQPKELGNLALTFAEEAITKAMSCMNFEDAEEMKIFPEVAAKEKSREFTTKAKKKYRWAHPGIHSFDVVVDRFNALNQSIPVCYITSMEFNNSVKVRSRCMVGIKPEGLVQNVRKIWAREGAKEIAMVANLATDKSKKEALLSFEENLQAYHELQDKTPKTYSQLRVREEKLREILFPVARRYTELLPESLTSQVHALLGGRFVVLSH
ncbi:unnamed protein product [Gongylonema pulchrum]|uniref:Dynein light chain n=1 Tax=Gongylonema pulchrum TaxID=637853 RepID=A0A183E1A7_9BILA|nr:unnamed protein product [Gongylonema pulchrum]